jgi:hypothetical protein
MEMTDAWASWIDVLLKVHLDWQKVVTLANHHRVLPLVYRCLYKTFREQVPESGMERLRASYQGNTARNLFLTQELLKILNAFNAEGLDVIPIKGPALAMGVYGDVTYRQFDDLDVLVHEEDVAAVSNLLQSNGYSPNIVDVGLEAQTVLKNEGECGFTSPCDRIHLDIHWKMVPRSFMELDHEGIWARSEIVTWDGQEDLLVLLSIHGMRHLWARHAWIVDLAQTVRAHPDLDWDHIFDRSRPIQVERFLNVGLLLAWEYQDLDLPEWVSNQIQADRAARSLVDDLRSSLDFHLPHKTSLIRMIIMNTRPRKGLRNKVHYFLGQILSPSRRDWSLIKLPGGMRFIYGLLRPIRVFKEYGIKPITRILAAYLGISK